MVHQSGCLICGNELVYLDKPDTKECYFCGKEFGATVYCDEGHFVCDHCHSADANDIIEWFCRRTDMTDPMKIAVAMMDNHKIKMHGPEHHFLVPAALTAAYYNTKGLPKMRNDMVQVARMRAEKIPGGFCGTHGNCGAAVGTGIFISIILHATPLSEEEWKMSNLMTARSLEEIANSGGPRCCKRDSYIAIIKAVDFVKENLDFVMDTDRNLTCHFSALNKQCRAEACSFFNENGR